MSNSGRLWLHRQLRIGVQTRYTLSAEVLSDRIFVPEVLSRKRLIDHRDVP